MVTGLGQTGVSKPDWQPEWLVDVGCGCELGIATDDHCFIVLYPHDGQWQTGKYIPVQVARRLGELAHLMGDCI